MIDYKNVMSDILPILVELSQPDMEPWGSRMSEVVGNKRYWMDGFAFLVFE